MTGTKPIEGMAVARVTVRPKRKIPPQKINQEKTQEKTKKKPKKKYKKTDGGNGRNLLGSREDVEGGREEESEVEERVCVVLRCAVLCRVRVCVCVGVGVEVRV